MGILGNGPLPTLKRPEASEAGAWVLFEGTVRSPDKGLAVEALRYDAYGEMVEAEGERILAEARNRWPLTDAVLRHGTGDLTPGQAAIQVGVLAAHRSEAFKAARWILEEAKRRLPVWKEEIAVEPSG